MGVHKDYFKGWIEEKDDSRYGELRDMYNRADEDYYNRFDHRSNKLPDFEEKLDDLNERWDDYQKDDALRKFAYLTKGNILLRKGQYLGERFQDPQECYQQACASLEQEYDPEGKDLLDFMIQLNLGKYFRNLGKYNQRSDYLRARDEFEDVKKKIEKRQEEAEGKFTYWETYMYLEAELNIGQTQRYLYLLSKAKECFLGMIGLLSGFHKETVRINDELDRFLNGEDRWKEKRERLAGDKDLYEDYLIKALVQLGIAYQKSRDYEMAQDICVAVLRMAPKNVDAANNLGVCLRKQGIETKLAEIKKLDGRENKSKYLKCSYKEIFDDLAKNENRFAKINVIKYMIREKPLKEQEIQKIIDELLERNPADQEVRLLEGLFLKEIGRLEDSQKIFESLYEESHHISKGTIGLKAYYNISNILLRKKQFRKAKKYFEKINDECRRTDIMEESGGHGMDGDLLYHDGMYMKNLPEGDLTAQIDIGWCLMKLGDYNAAKKRYEDILRDYQGMPGRLSKINRMKVKNNLTECCLRLVKGIDEKEDEKLLRKAREKLEEVSAEEPNNITVNWHWGYYYKLMSRKVEKPKQEEELEKALRCFRKIEFHETEDAYYHAGWVSTVMMPLYKEVEYEKAGETKFIQSIENRLQYSYGAYSIKECARLSFFVKMMEGRYLVNEYGEDKLEKMYRSLSRVRLLEDEEGYGLFHRFMENDSFRRLESMKRGELLASLFSLYEQIMEIKRICRFGPDERTVNGGFSVPVHYTKVNTLKKILSGNTGRLRLWNTIYMNDSFEGECFVEMMKGVEEKRLREELRPKERQDDSGNHSKIEEMVMEKLKRYFPYLNTKDSKEDIMNPINENIYVTSFSKLKNAIHMWIPYADDGKGCAITFAEDFFDIRKMEDTMTDVSSYTDRDYPLYEIQYLDEKKYEEWKQKKTNGKYDNQGNKSKIERIMDIMEKIWAILNDLEERMDGSSKSALSKRTPVGEAEKRLVRNFVAGCLNEVRFLIKNSEYSFEEEVRMLHYSDVSNIDTENFEIPRLFVEVDRDIRIEEVKLGPKISESQANEIFSWLTATGKVEHITKSGRHYK